MQYVTRKPAIFFLAVFLIFQSINLYASTDSKLEYAANNLIIKLKPEADIDDISELNQEFKITTINAVFSPSPNHNQALEELKQKTLAQKEMMNHLEEKLEESHKKAGNLTGKFEFELANLRNLLDDRNKEIKPLRDKISELKKKCKN